MNLFDPITLAAASAFVAVACGVFLLVMGWRYHAVATAGIWGLSGLVAAGGLVLFIRGDYVDYGFGAVIVAAELAWATMRRFFDRRQLPLLLAFGPLAWAAITFIPLGGTLPPRMAFDQILLALYLGAAAFELWRSREEKLAARWLLLIVTVAQTAIFVVGAVTVLVLMTDGGPIDAGTFTPAFIGTMAFVIGTSIFLVALIQERSVNEGRLAAATDDLTGLANRGGFFAAAPPALAAAIRRDAPAAAVLFDLDRFKEINDTYGHRVGDNAIQRFAFVLARSLRREDVCGRVGGEEFAVLLPGSGREAALAVAERIRAAFADEAQWIDGQPVRGTVSAGIAVSEVELPLEDLLDEADRALYAAKAKGRNRIAIFGEPDDGEPPTVIRYA